MKAIVIDLEKYLVLRLNLVVYSLGFLVPFLIAQPQLFTGAVVNALLYIAADRLDKKNLLPLLVLPSLGAVSHGVLFGPQTVLLVFFLPCIWLGNLAMVTIFSFAKQQSFALRVGASALAKYLLLYGAAHIYFRLNVVPKIFVTSMGMLQFVTACLGGLIAYFVIRRLNTHG